MSLSFVYLLFKYQHLLSTYFVPTTILGTLMHFNLTTILWSKQHYHPRFTDMYTEAQKAYEACSRLDS